MTRKIPVGPVVVDDSPPETQEEATGVLGASIEPAPKPVVVQAAPAPIDVNNSYILLAIGLGIITFVGLFGVIIYLMTKKNESGGLGQAPQLPYPYGFGYFQPQPQIFVIDRKDLLAATPLLATPPAPSFSSLLGPEPPRPRPSESLLSRDSKFNTVTLPNPNDQQNPSSWLFSATDRAYDVVVRVVSPPGQFATIAFDKNELARGAIPLGSTLVVNAGSQHTVRLHPRQSLYAKGSVTGVVVSIAASETVVGAIPDNW